MKKPFAVALIVCLLFLPAAASLVTAEEAYPLSKTAADSASVDSEDRGAGYLPYSEPTPLGTGGFFGAIVRTIFSLAVVIGLLYATLWVIRRFTGGATGPASEGAVQVVGRVYLSPKVAIYFLKLVDDLLVIGVNAGNISVLTTIKDEHEVSQIESALRSAYAQGPAPNFSRFFDKSMARFQKALDRQDTGFDDQLRSINEQIGRLRGLARKRQRDEE